ncbi:hypothetical protein CQW23_32552 [Capsicum baccatum]|uniref:Protein TAR1 n=1 Tax=Capsicum baccatum TaxID=33114 RepID=A0A2G2V4C6_CAPBA|nr:hypothetical protein CQW23_32552 [Capsicum baccatum]
MVPWCHGAAVPWCLGATVPWCQGARPPWCDGAMVPWFHGALVPWCHGCTPTWCHGAVVPWCHAALVPRCHGATVPWCLAVMVPWSLGALVPWCHAALVQWCHAALVLRWHGATVPWCHGALVPWRHGAKLPRCLGAMLQGFKASTPVICMERRTGQIGVDEGPMPTASTAFEMIGRADIEGSKSNIAMNAWLPQASYPCGNFSDTSPFEFRRSKGSLGTLSRWIPLVRTSSELVVQRAGSAPEGTVPSPSPGRHAATRSRRGSSSSSPPTADGFGTGTPVPSPQSQSFSQSYGSILPTSLAYIVPSTRGCSPWRPDAVMSTTGRGWHSVLRIFKCCRERTGHHATCGALPAAGPYLRLSRFQGGQAVKQKR